MADNLDTEIYTSVLKPGGVRLVIFIMVLSIFPTLIINMSETPDYIKTLLITLYMLTAYTYFTLKIYDRVRQGAVVVIITSEILTIIRYGETFVFQWNTITSVETHERILLAKAGKIGGIQLETNIKSGKFMKTTVDFFIPDLFDVSKEMIAEQIRLRKDHYKMNTAIR